LVSLPFLAPARLLAACICHGGRGGLGGSCHGLWDRSGLRGGRLGRCGRSDGRSRAKQFDGSQAMIVSGISPTGYTKGGSDGSSVAFHTTSK
jgi:hypothetical protein